MPKEWISRWERKGKLWSIFSLSPLLIEGLKGIWADLPSSCLLAWRPACTSSGGKEQQGGNRHDHNHQWDEHKLLQQGQRQAAWSGEKAQSQLWGESQCAAPTWELLTFYSLYLLGAGEGNTKRCAKVQIQCKTQIQKAESHYRHPHLRTLDLLLLLELTLAKTNTNTKLDIRPEYVHCLCACDFLRSFTTRCSDQVYFYVGLQCNGFLLALSTKQKTQPKWNDSANFIIW